MPMIDEMFTMLAPPFTALPDSASIGTSRRTPRKTPSTLIAMILRQSVSDSVSTAPVRSIPALLTRMCKAPCWLPMNSPTRSQDASSVTFADR